MNFSKYLILLAILWAAVFPALGQDADLPETFVFDSGTVFNYPANSDVIQDETAPEFASLELGSDQFLNLLDYLFFVAEGLAKDADLAEVMAWYVDYLFAGEVVFDAAMVESVDDQVGREALRLTYVDDAGNAALLLAVRFEDGGFGLLDGFADGTDFGADDLALAVAASFDSGSAPVAVVDTTPCTLSTSEADTVQLRVGPGTNRTVYAFLPPGRDFTPLGQATASDESEWFQLDKEEVAPNAAAAEAWVAADSVDTSGNCETIGEASAPPVIPIAPGAPTGGDAGSSGDSGAGGGESGPIAPVPGTWTISYASTGKGSCLDNPGFTFDFPVDWTPDVVQLSFNGASLMMNGNRFTPAGGAYSGVFTAPNGNSFELILRPVSSTQFVGEARLTGVVDGHTCSNTVPTTVTRN